MNKNVVFLSKRYQAMATENGGAMALPVYQTLTGYMRTRDAESIQAEIDESVLQEYSGLGTQTKCRAKTVKTYYTTHTFEQETTVEIVLPEGAERIEIKPDAAASKAKIDGNRVTLTTDETLYCVIHHDGDIFSGLRVFLDRAKPMPAKKKHTILFTEGIYTADNCEYIHLDENGTPVIDSVEDDTLIYIGKNAIVNAAIVLKGVKNVEIAGTGILTTLNRAQGADTCFEGEWFWGLFRENAVPNVYARQDLCLDAKRRRHQLLQHLRSFGGRMLHSEQRRLLLSVQLLRFDPMAAR